MKRILLPALLASIFCSCGSTRPRQTPEVIAPPPTVPVLTDTVPAEELPALTSLSDSASYSIGIFVVNFYKQQGITEINGDMVAKAIADARSGQGMLLSDEQANGAIMAYINKVQAEKSKTVIAAGEQFLAQNKLRPGVTTTASGLQYEVLHMGSGPKPGPTDSVTCHYRGTYIDSTEFENSYDSGQPVTFTVNGVIKGWTEALQLMPVGSKWKIYIPYQLGYGANDYFSIPGGSTLVFELELLGIPGKTKSSP